MASWMDQSSPTPDVAALHDVLLAELGSEWTPGTAEQAKCLAQYKELREAAQTARRSWSDLLRRNADRASCERAHDALAIAEQRCLAPLYCIFHDQNRS